MRQKTQVVVQVFTDSGMWRDVYVAKDKEAADKWRRTKGNDGQEYRIVRVIAEPRLVRVTQVEKRTLVEPGVAQEVPAKGGAK